MSRLHSKYYISAQPQTLPTTQNVQVTTDKIKTTWFRMINLLYLHSYVKQRAHCTQGRINHWANWENAQGLALEYQKTPLLVFHDLRLFNTRQNCRACWLLHLVYRLRKLSTSAFIVFEWLERIEPNSTTLYDPRITQKQCINGRPQNFFQGETSKFCSSFSVWWRCNANGRSQNALPFLHH